MMNATRKVKLKDITPNLTCPLCKGYLVDATTTIECLHSFCKSCIVTYLERSEFCPVCDVQLHSTKPLSSIRSDQMLQEIVYKLVPGLFQNEMERRRKFYREHPGSSPINLLDSGQMFNESYITSDDIIYLSLEYQTKDEEIVKSTKRYLKCPAAVSIAILKNLLRNKYDLTCEASVDIMYGDRVLPDDFLLMDIAYKYSWTPNGKHLPLSFKVNGNPSLFKLIDRPPLTDKPVCETKNFNGNQLSSAINSVESSEMPQTLKPLSNGQVNLNGKPNGVLVSHDTVKKSRKKKSLDTQKDSSKLQVTLPCKDSKEKEVQLRISENGVMSARNVASGVEKVISSKTVENDVRHQSLNRGKSSHLIIPHEVPPCVKPAKSVLPKIITSPKSKLGIFEIPPSDKGNNEALNVAKKVAKQKVDISKQYLKAPEKLNASINMKTMQLKLPEVKEATSYFAAEITPINSSPPPKNPQPKEGQKYPAATLHTTELASTKTTNPAYNKRLHQASIINGDVKFTKNVLHSPLKSTNTDPSVQSRLASPVGSPNKAPKFFKSRHVDAFNPEITEHPSKPVGVVNVTVCSTPTTSTTNHLDNGGLVVNSLSPNFNCGVTKMKVNEAENPPKKVKLDQPPSSPNFSQSVTIPSLGGSMVSTRQHPSFRNPAGYHGVVPSSLISFMTYNYSNPIFNNPNLKNVPAPYLDITRAMQSFSPNLKTASAVYAHGQSFNLPSQSNIAPKKIALSKQSPVKQQQAKISVRSDLESEKSRSETDVSQKLNHEDSIKKAQNLLTKIATLGVGVNVKNGNGKTSRKSMSPAKISRNGTVYPNASSFGSEKSHDPTNSDSSKSLSNNNESSNVPETTNSHSLKVMQGSVVTDVSVNNNHQHTNNNLVESKDHLVDQVSSTALENAPLSA